MTKRKAKAMTKTAKRRKAKTKAKTAVAVKTLIDLGSTTLRGLTDAFNAAVPQATKLGIAWAKHHTSLFESKALGQRVLARLQKEIMAAAKTG
jgi:hypothetical protein